MYWYYYVKPKYGEKPKLCYVDTDCFIMYIIIFFKEFKIS